MQSNQRHTINLGIFVILASCLLVLAIYLIGNNKNLFGANFLIHTSFGNASGLQKGNNVRYAGITIGTVDKIQIINDSSIQVDMRLQRDAQNFVRKNAVVSIGIDGIVGSALININPGQGDAPLVNEGDHLPSNSLTGVEEIMSSFGQTSANLGALSMEVLRTSRFINEGDGLVAALLRDSLFTMHLTNTLQHLERGAQMLVTIEKELQKSLSQVNNQPNNLHTLLYDTTLLSALQSVTKSLEKHLSQDQLSAVDSVAMTLQRTSKNLEKISQNVLFISNDLNNKSNLIQLLTNDTISSDNLRSTLHNLHQGTVLLNEDLKALQDNFLTRRYFRKKEREESKAQQE